MTGTTNDLPQLAKQFLAATDAPEHWLEHWKSRAWARNLLLRCRRHRSYVLTVDAIEALHLLEDMLTGLAGHTMNEGAEGR